MDQLRDLIRIVQSGNVQKREESLLELRKRTKDSEDVSFLHRLEFGNVLFQLLEEWKTKYQVVVLSILANCTNLNEQWREFVVNHEDFPKIKSLLNNESDSAVVSRVARLIANIAKSHNCVSLIEQDASLIQSLVNQGRPNQTLKTQQACLRALRNLCFTKPSAKLAAECDSFPDLLSNLKSSELDIVFACTTLICELLKTQCIEVGFRLVEDDVLKALMELGKHSSEDMRDLVLEIMFQLTVTTRCRVVVATEGAVELFVDRLRHHENTESFKFAAQGLCLCAREAVSRNLMKSVGALQEMARVLKSDDFGVYHEALVAAFVWFLFDDSSLGLLIRSDVTPSLLCYLDRLTYSEHQQSLELNLSTLNQLDNHQHPPEWNPTDSFNDPSTCDIGEPPRWMYMSSPESSPYHPYSPGAYNPCSPSVSLSYSPPHSPQSPGSPELYDGYSDALNESCGSSSKAVPYHFQSADGQHAMIHGTRGPIHDIMLLLSRFSQAKDPSSFFLYLPGFNSLLNHVALSVKPNPKCARLLNRVTSNSHCFDVLLKKKLVPRLHLRLCTGWSLEHLTHLLSQARQADRNSIDTDKEPEDENCELEEKDIMFLGESVTYESHRVGKLLLSNLQSQSQTTYGSGVLSKILSNGSIQLKETCVLSLPYIIWSKKLCTKLMIYDRGYQMFMRMLRDSLNQSNETFIMIVEAVCSLSQFLQVRSSRRCGMDYSYICDGILEVQDDDDQDEGDLEPPAKKSRLEEISDIEIIEGANETVDSSSGMVEFHLPNGIQLKCKRDLIRKHSKMFDRMFDPIYTESTKTIVHLTDVNEKAFVTLMHFVHGCKLRLDCYRECISCHFTGCENEKPNNGRSLSRDDKNVEELGDTEQWRFTMDLLSCAERFFVHLLKERCEDLLVGELSDQNVVEIYLLSRWNNCEILTTESVIHLLTKVRCPKLRIQFFMEILMSHEKDNFLDLVDTILSKKLKVS
ncbi:armadillo repeat-containing protein 5-like [Clytia hemisphaerica]|uniref:BTB domain-containing protein n=1 Tax=Clytia hemisphaerica TaxID=252671 RepID=A0A7M5X0R4_9CNID